MDSSRRTEKRVKEHMRDGKRRDQVLLLAAGFFYFSSPMAVTPIITGFSGSLGASAALMGLIGGLMNICSLCCRPFVGAFSDRMRKYILSCIGAVCLIVSCLGYVFAWSPQVVMAARIINGFGFALCSISLSTWFSLMLPKEHMGAGMGVYGTMNALAMALAPAVGIYCYHHLGYRAAFCVATAFAAAIIVLIQFVSYKNEPLPPAGKGFLPDQFVDTGVLPVSFLIMVFTIPYCATQSFLVQYVQAKGLPFSAGMFFPAYAVALLLLRTVMRDLFDRLSFQFFFIMACLCTAGSILLLAVMDSFWEMIAAAVLMAGSYGVMCSVCQALAIVVAAGGKRGLANSTYYIGIDLGMALGPLFGGLLFGALPISFFYPVLLVSLPAAAAIYWYGRRRVFSARSSAHAR